MRLVITLFLLTGCGGLAWNTEVADYWQVRQAMLDSVIIDRTSEKAYVVQWGAPTQKIREGGQVSYVYRNMANPEGYHAPQFGDSTRFVVVVFQFGVAIDGYSSETQGCRATFPPRPPGPGFDNPSTVKPVNCGVGKGQSGSGAANGAVPGDHYHQNVGYK